jgi:beta-galactosidase
VWLGSQPLGRFWSVGPQFALYTPGPWLHAGNNAITIFDLMGDANEKLQTTKEPIFGGSVATRN